MTSRKSGRVVLMWEMVFSRAMESTMKLLSPATSPSSLALFTRLSRVEIMPSALVRVAI